MRRNRNTLVGQPGATPHTALQRALLGKTDPLPDQSPGDSEGQALGRQSIPVAWALITLGLLALRPCPLAKYEREVMGDPPANGGGESGGDWNVPLPGLRPHRGSGWGSESSTESCHPDTGNLPDQKTTGSWWPQGLPGGNRLS